MSPTPLLSEVYPKILRMKFRIITPINARIYRNISSLLFFLSTCILATPIPTKYPTVGESAETSCITPDRNEERNIIKRIKETNITLRFRKNPQNQVF